MSAVMKRRLQRWLGTAILFAFPTNAVAQETIHVSCKVTAFAARDEGRKGNFGLQFILRLQKDNVLIWTAEKREWRGISSCPPGPAHDVWARASVPVNCSTEFTEGEVVHRISLWYKGDDFSSTFKVSRVTGIFEYSSDVWEEQGICSATENPESKATERAF